MSNVLEFKASRQKIYNGIKITMVYDHDKDMWLWGFELNDFIPFELPVCVFDYSKTPDEGFTRAEARVDKLLELFPHDRASA